MSSKASFNAKKGFFGASGSAAFSSLSASAQNNSDSAKDVQNTKRTFHNNFTQIYRDDIINVNIDGQSAVMTKTKFVNAVPICQVNIFVREAIKKY